MPMDVTIGGRGQIARIEDFARVARDAFLSREFKDYRMALEMIVGIANVLIAEYDAIQRIGD